MKTRSEIAHEEVTRDPIFLLQERVVHPNTDCTFEFDVRCDCYMDSNDEPISEDYLVENYMAATSWRPILVFMTREERELYGEQTSYRYGRGRKNIDWKVFCIPCEGELVLLLRNKDELK